MKVQHIQKTKKEEKIIKNKANNKKEKKKKNIKINFMILAIVLIMIYSIAITPVTLQNDTYYTIKIGELITKNGIDMQDHFSWHENLSYTYPHWLYDLLTYLIYEVFNIEGIFVITCILSAILGLSIFLVNKKLVKNDIISFIVTGITMYMLQGYIAARAQLVTFILFIWTIYFIEKFLENKKVGYAMVLVIISTLIANLHAATWPFFFILFLPYIAEYIIAVMADTIIYKKIKVWYLKEKIRILSKKEKNDEKIKGLKNNLKQLEAKISKIKIKRQQENKNPYKISITRRDNVKWIVIVMIICILTGLLTPLGDTPYTYLYKTMKGNTTENISEHLPMTLINHNEAMCTIVLFLAILIFTKAKIRLSDLFMIAGLCYLMLSTRRQFSMFVLICSIILNRLVKQLLEIYTDNALEKLKKVFQDLIVGILVSVLVLVICYYTVKPKIGDEYISSSSYPIEACDYILENIDIEKAKFYNEYNYGSYMLFRGIPVFIDSRADLYSPEFSGNKDRDVFSDFISTNGIATFYEDTFEKYGITHIICYKKSKVNLVILKTDDKNYRQLYLDDNFVIYERLNVKSEAEN